jgi:hypothetical protein
MPGMQSPTICRLVESLQLLSKQNGELLRTDSAQDWRQYCGDDEEEEQ